MQAGKLRHRVTIQRRATGSPDRTASGAPDDTWIDVATVWAAIEPLRGREFLESQTINAAITVRIRIRYRAGIDAAMRAVHGSTVYALEAPPINFNMRNIELHLMCSQGANNG